MSTDTSALPFRPSSRRPTCGARRTISSWRCITINALSRKPGPERSLEGHLSELSQTLTLYKGTHAARTHPVLYGMLADHHRLDLAEQEDRAIEDIGAALRTLAMHLNRIETAEGDRLMTRVAQGLDQLMDAHTQIDIEMKHEGDRLVG